MASCENVEIASALSSLCVAAHIDKTIKHLSGYLINNRNYGQQHAAGKSISLLGRGRNNGRAY